MGSLSQLIRAGTLATIVRTFELVQDTMPPPLTTVSTVDPIKVFFTLSEQQYLSFNQRNLIAGLFEVSGRRRHTAQRARC
ncbi:MAG: hypothetical protein DMF76_20335 [Acidobacteria bacterium]|nr:MAG: hypothetical protein DMF76_20335 [Acidobacteriota bacterium]